jgi:arsenate reductase
MRNGIDRLLLFVAALSLAPIADSQDSATARTDASPAPVVFVCEHGNVKSLIGASLFDKVAKERGLPFRAVSRGVTPESSVPPKIVAALRGDSVDVEGFKPQPLTARDISAASRVIAIGVDLSSFTGEALAPIELWSDVPPASVDYAASRAALLRHIEALLDEMYPSDRPIAD